MAISSERLKVRDYLRLGVCFRQLWSEYSAVLHSAVAIFFTVCVGSVAGTLASIVTARLYEPSAVAVGGVVISMTIFVASIANFGFTTLILQRLRQTAEPARLVGAIYILSTLFAFAAAISLIPIIPARHPLILAGYVLLAITTLLYSTHEAACFALGLAGYAARRAVITQFLRLTILLLLQPFGTVGIVASVAISTTIMVIWVHLRVLTPFAGAAIYRFGTTWFLLRTTARSLGANYLNDWLGWVPIALFPVIVLHAASAEQSAIGYIVLMVTTTAASLPGALITAEFSRRSGEAGQHQRGLHTDIILLVLLVAGGTSLVAMLAAPRALALFGHFYQAGGTVPLQILLGSLVPMVGRGLFVADCRLRSRTRPMVLVAVASASVLVVLTALGAMASGLTGAAAGWTLGQWGAALLTADVWRRVVGKRALYRALTPTRTVNEAV